LLLVPSRHQPPDSALEELLAAPQPASMDTIIAIARIMLNALFIMLLIALRTVFRNDD